MNMIRNYIKKTFLTAGAIRGNYVFYSVTGRVKNYLTEIYPHEKHNVPVVVFNINRAFCEKTEEVLHHYDNKFNKTFVANRLFFTTVLNKLIKEGLISDKVNSTLIKENEKAMEMFENFDPVEFQKNTTIFPMYSDFLEILNRGDVLELSFVLNGCNNKFLQHAMNDLLFHSKQSGIKIFTDKEKLISHKRSDGEMLFKGKDFKVGDDIDSGIKLDGKSVYIK